MKSFIIHLSKIQSSYETALNLKKQLDKFNMPAELFEGTYGNDAVRLMDVEGRTIHPWGIKGPNRTSFTDTKEGKIQTPGVKGCFLSHYNLWKKCVELNEPIIIWEDDINLIRPYFAVDWQDVLILALGHPTKSGKYMHYLDNPTGDPRPEGYHQSSMPGCCGYAIKPHAAKKLLEIYEKTYLPADNAINQYHVKIQIHSHVMGIAKVEGKKSLTKLKSWHNI